GRGPDRVCGQLRQRPPAPESHVPPACHGAVAEAHGRSLPRYERCCGLLRVLSSNEAYARGTIPPEPPTLEGRCSGPSARPSCPSRNRPCPAVTARCL